MSRRPEKITESCTEIVELGTLLLPWIGKSVEDHFLDSMLITGILKTYFDKGGLMFQIKSLTILLCQSNSDFQSALSCPLSAPTL